MANTVKTTKATATPRKASAKNEKAAEVAKPTTTPRKKIALVAEPEAAKKQNATTKPRNLAAKKDNVVAISQPAIVSREKIAQLAYLYWVQRGCQHGYALQDWVRAEQELLQRAS